MSRREYLLYAAAATALIVAVVVGTGLGWWGSSTSGSSGSGAPPVRPLSARVSLTPHPILFGDPVLADVDVQIDPERVDADSVRVTPRFEPFIAAGAPAVTRERVGRHETVRFRYRLTCLSDDCVPKRKDPLVLQLKPVVATAVSGGKTLTARTTWPQTAILSRLQRKDLGSAKPHFRRPQTVPPPSYAVSPSTLANVLTVVAGLLALGGLALLVRELGRLLERRRRRAQVELTPLEAALAYTRDAAARPDPADRRKALELLAKTLDAEGAPALAGTAEHVAWSEEPPSPDRALELADEAESAPRNGS